MDRTLQQILIELIHLARENEEFKAENEELKKAVVALKTVREPDNKSEVKPNG